MNLIIFIFIILGVIALTNAISPFMPSIPVSLVQIVAGLLIGLNYDLPISFNSQWFLILFIAPLLFNDAQSLPLSELWELKGPIFANSIFLVFMTTIIGGYLIHLIIPSLSLAASFAIAAIVSPTDPVAVQSIAKSVKLPSNILHILSGESLINDASGLIAFNFAIKSALFGGFILSDAVFSFLYVSIMGVIAGYITISIITWSKNYVINRGINDIFLQLVISILTPVVVYLVSEDVFHASGVIAVVTSGIYLKIHNRTLFSNSFEFNVVSDLVWKTVTYILTGSVFIIMGLELPFAMKGIIQNDYTTNTFTAILYGIGAWFVIFSIRVTWTYIYQFLNYRKEEREKKSYDDSSERDNLTEVIPTKPSFKFSLISGISGVRGAVTIVGILSIESLPGINHFPGKQLMLFVTAIIVIMSFLVATIFLPLIIKNPKNNKKGSGDIWKRDSKYDYKYSLKEAELHISKLTLEDLLKQQSNFLLNDNKNYLQVAALNRIIFDYQTQVRKLIISDREKRIENLMNEKELELGKEALVAERVAIEKLYSNHKIGRFAYIYSIKNIDRSENNMESMNGKSLTISKTSVKRILEMFITSLLTWISPQPSPEIQYQITLATRARAKSAIKSVSKHSKEMLSENTSEENKKIITQSTFNLISFYRASMPYFNKNKKKKATFKKYFIEISLKIFAFKRKSITTLYEKGEISRENGLSLIQNLTFEEMDLLQDDE